MDAGCETCFGWDPGNKLRGLKGALSLLVAVASAGTKLRGLKGALSLPIAVASAGNKLRGLKGALSLLQAGGLQT